MDSVDKYLADILASIRPLPPRELALADALGAVLAGDVAAQYPLPSFDNSAMDGYAVRSADVEGASENSPVTLPVHGEIAAGDTGPHVLVPGSVIRIMTGAALPPGADAVVPVEQTDGGIEQVTIRQGVAAGDSVRRTGGDAKPGDLLLTAGTRLGAVHLGLLAAAGRGTVLARPRPRVTVISTGDELVDPGTALIPGQIWESNATMLAAAAREAGCAARRYPIVRDTTGAVLEATRDALDGADLLVTSGKTGQVVEVDPVTGRQLYAQWIDTNQAQSPPGNGDLFGLAMRPDGKGFYYVEDDMNTLMEATR